MRLDYPIVTNAQELTETLERCRAAQAQFATYTQVDRIFLAAATAANKARIPLAKQAVAETGMGVVEDKVIKNHYAAEYIYNAYKEKPAVSSKPTRPTATSVLPSPSAWLQR